MSYTCSIWWTGKKVHTMKLTKVQNNMLRHMAATFKIMSVKALEVDILIPPVEIILERISRGYTDKLHRLKTTNPVMEQLLAE